MMLVLSRKLGESIVIGDDVRVTIIHVGGGRVRLGVEAPLATPVHRAEVSAKIAREAGAREPDSLAIH